MKKILNRKLQNHHFTFRRHNICISSPVSQIWVESLGTLQHIHDFSFPVSVLQITAYRSGDEQAQIIQFLNFRNERLIGEFDALAEKQKSIPADEYNNDDKYKLYLNGVSKLLPKKLRNC